MKTAERKSIKKSKKSEGNKTLRELLLESPVMTKEQYAEFKVARKHFNKWRAK
jgi:hypothetical protein